MSKDKRKQLKPVDKNNVLIEIDLKSCEPSFYLRAIGRSIDGDDVYADIARKLNFPMHDRSKFKRGILSVLYGASKNTSKNILKCSLKDLEKIKDYFQIDDFKSSLKDEFSKEGIIYNYYGRPICYDHNLMNYWIQSSAVDYCSFSFFNLLKQYDIKPCFFVHDSMTVEVPAAQVAKILSIEHVYDDYSDISISVDVSLLS